MAKYVYIDGKRYEVVNNYILGLDVYSDDSIPTPAVADSGKVLGVDEEGKYALTEAGGSGVVFCTFDLTDVKTGDNGNYVESDITAEAIYNAILSGNTVYAKFSGENAYGIPEAVSVIYGISYTWDTTSQFYDTYRIIDESSYYLCIPPTHITSFGVNAAGKIEAYIYTD